MDLISLAKGILNDQVMGSVSDSIGAGKEQTQEASSDFLHILLGGLAKNASTPEGAAALDKAVSEDHDGGLLDNITSLFGNEKPADVKDTTLNSDGILKHILGDKKDASVDLVAKKTGMDKETALNLLLKLAPVAMAMLGKAKKDTGADATGLAGLLKNTQSHEQSDNPFMAIVGKFLDKDGDGSYMDDIMDMVQKKLMS